MIAGSTNAHIATLVERQSRFMMLVQPEGKDTETIVRALAQQVRRLPVEI